MALVKSLPLSERPITRISELGPQYVTTLELLAAIVGGENQIEKAQEIIALFDGDLNRLRKAKVEDFMAIKDVGPRIAAMLVAAIEFGSRLATAEKTASSAIHSPSDCASLVQYSMSGLEQEEMWIILLTTRNEVISIDHLYKGSINSSQIRVGEIFKAALRKNAAAVVVCHNHPSGDPTPSPDDVAVTRAIISAGKLMDIDVLDHLVIGQGRFVSLKERGLGGFN